MTKQTTVFIGLIIYALIMLSVTIYFMIRVKKSSDYLVGGRHLPGWALTGNVVGTCIGTGVVIGASGLAYQHGWAGSAYPIGLGLGTLIVGLIFAKMRRYNFMTLGEEIACYYAKNPIVVEFSNISLFISEICWLAVQIMGGGAVLSVVTGWDPKISLIFSGIITSMITIPGGLKTVIYSDFLQAAILLTGFIILIHIILENSNGFHGLYKNVPNAYSSFLGVDSFGGWKVVSLILVIIINPIAGPARRLTMYSARSEAGARWSMITAGFIVILFSVCVGVIGMYTYTLNPHLESADQALPWLVTKVLPAWLSALVVVSISSAIFSSANGDGATVGTFFVRHIFPLMTNRFPKNPLVVVRRALAVVFIVSTTLALYAGNIVAFVANFLALTTGGLAVIIIVGRFWKRATWQGALAALITTPLTTLIIMFFPILPRFQDDPIIPATIIGVLAEILVSLMTKINPYTFDEIAKSMFSERQAIE
jgi:solute:Na+ symporter, SSS family